MTDEVETAEPASTGETQAVPPEAFERVKRERDEARTDGADTTAALAQALLVDKIHEYWESLPSAERPENPRQAANFLSAQLPPGVEDVPAAIQSFVAKSNSLRPPTTADAPLPPMAGNDGGSGPQPGAAGGQLETGPKPMNGPEFLKFFEDNGKKATMVAISNGQFYPTPRNADAQGTIDDV
jgi:hypothetical protein